MLSELILHHWPSTKPEVQEDLQPYWSFRAKIAITDGIAMKSRRIIIPAALQDKALKQVLLNHMGFEKTILLVHESIYWINMSVDIEEMVKKFPICLDFQAMGICRYFTINNNFYLCIVDYHSKFPVIKQVKGFSKDNLPPKICKILFSECGFPSKIISDMGTNPVSEKFKTFCRWLSICHTVGSLYNCQTNGQAEACIKFVMRTIKKYYETNNYLHLSLLQIRLALISPRLPSPVMLLLKSSSRAYCQDSVCHLQGPLMIRVTILH